MADIHVNPTVAGPGSGTFEDPYSSWASTYPWTAGNRYMQAYGTTFTGTIGTTGTGGTVGSRIIVGVYDTSTGAQVRKVKGAATLNATGQTHGFNLTEARPYITIEGFEIYGATSACITKTSTGSSSTEVQSLHVDYCILRNSLGVGADLRGASNKVRHCDVYDNASDGLFVVGDNFELGHTNTYLNGLTNPDGDAVQIRDGSYFWIHDCDIDHGLSLYKQGLIVTLQNVAGTTGGRIERTRIACAQYIAGVTADQQKTVQILVPAVTMKGVTIVGGQYGAYLQAEGVVLEDSTLTVTGTGAVGVAIREADCKVRRNTVNGAGGFSGIDHSSASYTGVEIDNNKLDGWARGIRSTTGAAYSHNAFRDCDLNNSNLADAEGTAGEGDVEFDADESDLSQAGVHQGYVLDFDGRLRHNPPSIGAVEG